MYYVLHIWYDYLHAAEAWQPNQGFVGGSLECNPGELTVATGTLKWFLMAMKASEKTVFHKL